MTNNSQDTELEALAERFWIHVAKAIEAILTECDLHELSGVLYVKNPSIADRLKILEKIESLFESLKEPIADQKRASAFLNESNIGITGLRLVLGAAKNCDESSFNFARTFLSGHLLNASENVLLT